MLWYGFRSIRSFSSITYKNRLSRRYLSSKSGRSRPNLVTFYIEDYKGVIIHDGIRCPFSGNIILLMFYNFQTDQYRVSSFSKESFLSEKSQSNLYRTYFNYYQLNILDRLSRYDKVGPYKKKIVY
jgi:hypothetical protein